MFPFGLDSDGTKKIIQDLHENEKYKVIIKETGMYFFKVGSKVSDFCFDVQYNSLLELHQRFIIYYSMIVYHGWFMLSLYIGFVMTHSVGLSRDFILY